MEKISTTELDKILKNSTVEDYEKFAETHYVETYTDLADYLNQYIAIHDLRIPQIIKASHLSKNYAYAIFNGHKKNPSRDRIIALCIAMGMTFEEVKRPEHLRHRHTLFQGRARRADYYLFAPGDPRFVAV